MKEDLNRNTETKERKSGTTSVKNRIFSAVRTAVWLVFAVLCVLYGITVYLVGSGTSFFLVWFALAAGFVFLAFAALIGLWKKLPKAVRVGVVAVVTLGIVFFTGVEGLILTGFDEKGEENLDAIIVLGSQVYANGPSVVLRYRLDEAIRYLNENPETVCIVTGGQGYNEPFPEAEGMADYLIKNGIDEDRILLEPESTNTKENIGNSLQFIDANDRIGIVTNNYHVFRGVGVARKAGLKNVCGISADSAPRYLPNNMLREFFGVVKYFLVGDI